MPKNIFVFNINKTLLWAEEFPKTINQIPITLSTWPAYRHDNIHVINKEKIAKVMQEILANGDQIAFLQEVPMPEKNKSRKKQREEQDANFLEFCSHEYGLSLRPNSIHFHHGGDDKVACLLRISEYQQLPHQNIILIDSNKNHTRSARKTGFQAVDVDSNWDHNTNCDLNPSYGLDSTHGKQYIKTLETIVSKQTLFLKAKESLQQIHTSTEKQLLFSKCDTLQELCFAAAIRQKSGIFHPQNTTTTGNMLIQLLNRPENYLLKLQLCPQGEKVRVRDIRHYALYGHQEDYKRSSSTCFLNMQDSKNESFFSHKNNDNPKEPTLLFNNRAGYYLSHHELDAAIKADTKLNNIAHIN
ncbi:hypothetical protein [Piscirickettsia salmonis]|uniref:hypothetical protein n=1 Tax=Piscirickettsia salmonis TaxID=1238 RepID=UPI0007C88722|nr:hypothetical protein A0O36_00237 [Piscirickettsiaceae bacterium NZ-RLO1]